MAPRLFLNHVPDLNWLIALQFGRVDDGQPSENWRGASEDFGWYYDGADGPCLGFKVLEFSGFDPEDDEVAEIWTRPPSFDAPLLGLRDVSAGEIVLAAKSFFDGAPSINRVYFNAAASASGEDALHLWRACLEAGDSMAHFALGYTLHELGRHAEAYRHLRHYTEIAPNHSWNWAWLAKAAAAIGETEEAIRACERANELTEAGDAETDAPELLDALLPGA